MGLPGLTPPPPIPRRVLTYNPSVHPLQAADMRMRTVSIPSANPMYGAIASRPSSSSHSNMAQPGCVMPGTPGPCSGRNLHAPTSAGASPACQSTLCFHDHRGHLAIMVPGPATNTVRSANTEPSTADKSGYKIPTYRTEPSIPISQGITAHDPSKHDRPQLTVQLYCHSSLRAFHNERNLRNVDQWCRQLQCSIAFQYLRHKLGHHGAFGGLAPTVRIEAYDALHNYKDIINHSLNEREYRGLQECFEHTERFLQYTRRMGSKLDPGLPEQAAAKAKVYMEDRNFIKHQMEDIRNGDGGNDRRLRAALREQLGPAFDDGRGALMKKGTDGVGSSWSCNRTPASVDRPLIPLRSDGPQKSLGVVVGAPISPSAGSISTQHQSPRRPNFSPGQAEQRMNKQQAHAISPSALDPRLRPGGSMDQYQQLQRGRQITTFQPATTQPAHNRSRGEGDRQPSLNPMPPPPTPAQGFQRPRLALPREGSVAKPFKLAPFRLDVKSIYRGVSQPYHNVVLIIDTPQWATAVGGVGVLRFGYEHDWAQGENVQRSGACFERVSMTKGTGRRWLGDVLVECFVGDGHEEMSAWLKKEVEVDDKDRVVWPGGHGAGGTDEGFGAVSDGSEIGKAEDGTLTMLKKLSVPGAENVDFLDGEWCGLL